MSRSLRRVAAIAVSAVALVVSSSCTSSTSPNLTPAQLAGSYVLLSFQSQGGPVMTPTSVPAATGTIVLTTTRYTLALTVAGTATPDSGTYTVSGSTFSETSDVTTLTYTGTASLSNTNVLSVAVQTPAGLVSTTFQKQ